MVELFSCRACTADGEKLVVQLNGLVSVGNTVIVVEHDMSVVADSDWVIDVGLGTGEGPSSEVAIATSGTAEYLQRHLKSA